MAALAVGAIPTINGAQTTTTNAPRSVRRRPGRCATRLLDVLPPPAPRLWATGLAGFLLAPLFHIGNITSGDFSLPALLVSLLGSVVLLAIVNLFRRGAVR